MMPAKQPVAVVYHQLHLPQTEKIFFIASLTLVALGIFIIISTSVLSSLQIENSRKRSVLFRDDSIAPPRCDSKAAELGLTKVKPWKDYFTRQESFIPYE